MITLLAFCPACEQDCTITVWRLAPEAVAFTPATCPHCEAVFPSHYPGDCLADAEAEMQLESIRDAGPFTCLLA